MKKLSIKHQKKLAVKRAQKIAYLNLISYLEEEKLFRKVSKKDIY